MEVRRGSKHKGRSHLVVIWVLGIFAVTVVLLVAMFTQTEVSVRAGDDRLKLVPTETKTRSVESEPELSPVEESSAP